MKKSEELLKLCREADLYKGTQITRWTTRNFIKSENDCEHQNIVTQLVMIILSIFENELDIETERNALGLAAIHDMFEYTEGGLGDIPHHIKEKSPEIRRIVEDHEYETITSKPFFGKLYSIYSSNEIAKAIVDLADTLDVVLYIDREFDLGNQDKDFKEIHPRAIKRVEDRYKTLLSKIKGESDV